MSSPLACMHALKVFDTDQPADNTNLSKIHPRVENVHVPSDRPVTSRKIKSANHDGGSTSCQKETNAHHRSVTPGCGTKVDTVSHIDPKASEATRKEKGAAPIESNKETPRLTKEKEEKYDHVLGVTLTEPHKYHLNAKTGAQPRKKDWPNSLLFRGTWNGIKNLRILVDSGSSAECLINHELLEKLKPTSLQNAETQQIKLLTGGGIIEHEGLLFRNQAITSNGFRVAVKTVQSADLARLEYDLILGFPFLCRTNANPSWRTGELSFEARSKESHSKKRRFKWIPSNEKSEEPSMCAITAMQANELVRTQKAKVMLLSVTELLELQDLAGIPTEPPPPATAAKVKTAADAVSKDLKPEENRRVVELLESYNNKKDPKKGLFSQKDNLPTHPEFGTRPESWKMNIPLKADGRTPKAGGRRFSPKEMEEIERIVKYLLIHKFISPSTSRFASPVLLVKKKDGNFRFCVDFRQLNESSHISQGPLPDIRQLTDRLVKAKYLSSLDYINGYWQLGIAEEDRYKTAMRTPYGLFEWNVVCMGLAGATSHFQTVMSSLIGPMTDHGGYTANLLDDILVYSDTFEDHMRHLKAVLDTIHKANFYLNLSKCKFFQKRVLYLGNVVGNGERAPDPDKVKALLEHPEPTTATELRAFLGIGNYLSVYLKDWSKLTSSYGDQRSLGKSVAIKFNEEQKRSFQEIKKALSEAPILKLPDFKKRFYVMVDASKTGIGSALLQEHDGILFPVAFRSTLLSKAQKNWPIHDLEASAMIDACKHFRPYLADREFTVLSDHKPLEHLKTQEKLNMRQIRWLDFLAMFQYKFEYIAGEDNIYADPLSRPPGHTIDVIAARPNFKESSCSLCRLAAEDEALAPFDMPGIPGLPEHQVFQHTCASFAQLHATGKLLAGGNYRTSTTIAGVLDVNIDSILEGYKTCPFSKEAIEILRDEDTTHHYKRKYTIIEGLIYLRPHESGNQHRLLIPHHTPKGGKMSIRQELIRMHHDPPTEGHREADTTYLRLRERFYFPNMHKSVVNFCKQCDKCLRNKYLTKKPTGLLQPVEYPALQPNAEVATDFAVGFPPSVRAYTGVAYNAIQVIVCRLSRKVRLLPCRDTDTAELTARNWMDNVFPQSGLPRSIVSDRDPKFTSEFWREISKIIGTRLRLTSSHNPRADGLSEKIVGVVSTMIRIFVSWNQTDWVDQLGMFEFALNRHATRSRGGLSPFMIVDGYVPFSATDLALPAPGATHNATALDFVRKQKVAARLAQDAIIAAQDTAANIYNRKRSTHIYKKGDYVLLKSAHVYPPGERERPSTKLRDKYIGPFKVIRNIGANAVELELKGGLQNHPVFAIESTKPYPPDIRVQRSKAAPDEDDTQQTYVKDILTYKIRQRRRMWLVEWAGIVNDLDEPQKTWEPFASFISSDGINQQFVEFEEDRTHLRGSTETAWQYPDQTPGTCSKEADGFTVYHSLKDERISTIAKKLKVPCNDLYEQNVLAYIHNGDTQFKVTSYLKKGTQLRLPMNI